MKHTKTFSDGGVASAANDVTGDKSAVDHLGDGLRDGRGGDGDRTGLKGKRSGERK